MVDGGTWVWVAEEQGAWVTGTRGIRGWIKRSTGEEGIGVLPFFPNSGGLFCHKNCVASISNSCKWTAKVASCQVQEDYFVSTTFIEYV